MGKNWAIAIGINGYQNMRPLKYAQRDAESICTFFRDELQFDRADLFAQGAPPVEYEDGPPINSVPTFGNLKNFFDVRFERPFLSSGDNLWFFFAGHGKRHQGRDYLMPIDSSPRLVSSLGISISEIAERLRLSGADNVILMIDACRGEDDRDIGEGIGREEQKGIITLFACSPNELSYEIDELAQGAFTHALLSGLKIQGAGNCATVERLDQYLKRTVPELNLQHQKPEQNPYTRIEPVSKSHLILLPSKATLSDVLAMKSDAQEAELANELDRAEQLWTRVLAASPADGQAIKGLQRIAIRRVSVQSPSSPAPVSEQSSSRDSVEKPQRAVPIVTFSVVRVNPQGEVIDRRENQAEQGLIKLPGDVELSLVKIPGGEFWMGAKDGEEGAYNDERPRHQVKLKSFWMGQYPITQRQWRSVASFDKVNIELDPDCSSFKEDELPVERVSWYQAVEFCDRLSRHVGKDYRLPTEAQWEYACRSRTETPFYCGETITTNLGNYRGQDWDYQGTTYPGKYGQGPYGEFRERTTSISQFDGANVYGLYDMHGNVFEWCRDHWHENYEGAPNDGSAWLTNDENAERLLRGGSWDSVPWACRSAARGWYAPDNQYNCVGFRVVCVSSRAF